MNKYEVITYIEHDGQSYKEIIEADFIDLSNVTLRESVTFYKSITGNEKQEAARTFVAHFNKVVSVKKL